MKESRITVKRWGAEWGDDDGGFSPKERWAYYIDGVRRGSHRTRLLARMAAEEMLKTIEATKTK